MAQQHFSASSILKSRQFSKFYLVTPHRTFDLQRLPPHLRDTCAKFLTDEHVTAVSAGTDFLRNASAGQLPTLRRVLACANLIETNGGFNKFGVDGSTTTSLDELAVAYFTHYVRTAKTKQAVYFHHISKAGGSAVCSQAWLNGCRPPGDPLAAKNVPTPPEGLLAVGGNCWSAAFNDRFLWWQGQERPMSAHDAYSCSKRLEFMHKVGLNFMANEGYLSEPENEAPCSGHDLLTLEVMREPMARTISHFAHAVRGNWHMSSAAHCVTEAARKNPPPTLNMSHLNMTCLTETHVVMSNNYQVRMMAGRDAYTRPLDKMLPEDLERARNALLHFDVLSVLQTRRQFAFPVPNDVLYRVGLGFQIVDRPTHKSNQGEYSKEFDVEFLAQLKRLNAMDSRLFDLAEDLYELDSFLYNRTYHYCQHLDAQRSSLAKELSCEAFLAPAIVSSTHPNPVIAASRTAQKPHSCGCGWAGSNSRDKQVATAMPALTGSSNRQACPRKGLFESRELYRKDAVRRGASAS